MQENRSSDSFYKTGDVFNDQPLGYKIDVIVPFKKMFYVKAGYLSASIEGASEGTGPNGDFTATGDPYIEWKDFAFGAGLTRALTDFLSAQAGVDVFIGNNYAPWEVRESDGDVTGADTKRSFAAQAGGELTLFVTRHIPISAEVNYVFTADSWLHGLSYGVGIGYAF